MCLALSLTIWTPAASAGQIYHWTDKYGHDHITEDPPPPDGQLKETIEYTPRSELEQTGLEEQQQRLRTASERQDILMAVEQARQAATEARLRAREAQAVADELEQRAAEFKATRGNTNYRRQKNKSIIIQLENDAREAEKLARQAEAEARQAEQRAEQIEKKAAEMMVESEAAGETEPLPDPQNPAPGID